MSRNTWTLEILLDFWFGLSNPVSYLKLMPQIFLACPHRYSSIAELEDQVAEFIFTNKKRFHDYSIKDLVKSIIAINGSFAGSPAFIAYRILNIFPKFIFSRQASLFYITRVFYNLVWPQLGNSWP